MNTQPPDTQHPEATGDPGLPTVDPAAIPDELTVAQMSPRDREEAAASLLYWLHRDLVGAQQKMELLAEMAGVPTQRLRDIERRAVADEFDAMEQDAQTPRSP